MELRKIFPDLLSENVKLMSSVLAVLKLVQPISGENKETINDLIAGVEFAIRVQKGALFCLDLVGPDLDVAAPKIEG